MTEFNFDEFLEFIKTDVETIKNLYNFGNFNEQVYNQLAKLTEEVGELSSEVAINIGHCRASKLHDNHKELSKEFADTAIVLFGLAKIMKVDMKQSITDKIKIIKDRNYK